MPNRVIREGLLSSSKYSQLRKWRSRCIYFHLLLNVDDAGRIEYRPEWLRTRLFPVGPYVRTKDIEDAIHEIVNAGLATRWTAPNGQQVLQLTNWYLGGTTQRSIYPDPVGNYTILCYQVPNPNPKAKTESIWVVATSWPKDKPLPAGQKPQLPQFGRPSSKPPPNPLQTPSGRGLYTNTYTDTETETNTSDVGRRTDACAGAYSSVRPPPAEYGGEDGLDQQAKALWRRYGQYWPHKLPVSERDRRLLWQMCYLAAGGQEWAKTALNAFEEACQSQRVRRPGAMLQRIRLDTANRMQVADADAQRLAVPVPDWVLQPPRKAAPADQPSSAERPPPSDPSGQSQPNPEERPLTPQEWAALRQACLQIGQLP